MRELKLVQAKAIKIKNIEIEKLPPLPNTGTGIYDQPFRQVRCLVHTGNQSFIAPIEVNHLPKCTDEEPFEGFAWDSQKGLLYYQDSNADGVLTQKYLCNFKLKFIKKLYFHTDNAADIYYEVELSNNRCKVNKNIPTSKAHEFPKLYIAGLPQFYIENCPDHLLKKYCAEKISELKEEATEHHYKLTAWHKFDSNYYFMHGGIANVESPLRLVPNSEKALEFVNIFLKILPEEKASFLLAYATTAYTAIFFEEANVVPCAGVLQICGTTGVGKTIVSKILAGALYSDPKADFIIRYDDTNASIEELIAIRPDQLLLIDDRYLTGSKAEDEAMAKAYNRTTRVIGDGRARKKFGTDGNPLENRKYRGAILSTAEFFSLPTLSSILRSILFEIHEGEFNFDIASILQDNRDLANAFFSSFILWLQYNQKFVINYLNTENKRSYKYYKKACATKEARIISMANALGLQVNLLNQFLAEIDTSGSGPRIPINVVETHIRGYSTQIEMLKPENQFLIAITYCIEAGWLELTNREEEFKNGLYNGFTTATEIVISSVDIDQALKQYNQMKKTIIKLDKTFEHLLVKAGIMFPRKNPADRDKYVRFKTGTKTKNRIHVVKFYRTKFIL